MIIAEIKKGLTEHTFKRDVDTDEGFIVLTRLEKRLSDLSKMFLREQMKSWTRDELSDFDEFVIAQDNLLLALIESEELKDEEEI